MFYNHLYTVLFYNIFMICVAGSKIKQDIASGDGQARQGEYYPF